MNTISKVISRTNWEEFKKQGELKEQSLFDEGFIHCSFLNQSVEVANKYFTNELEVLLLIIDRNKVKAEVKYELATNKQEYPHIYGPLNVDSVTKVLPFKKSEEGYFELPGELTV